MGQDLRVVSWLRFGNKAQLTKGLRAFAEHAAPGYYDADAWEQRDLDLTLPPSPARRRPSRARSGCPTGASSPGRATARVGSSRSDRLPHGDHSSSRSPATFQSSPSC
ncbi:MAG: hypothetical protein U0359_15080 [Byssovorax sp.]